MKAKLPLYRRYVTATIAGRPVTLLVDAKKYKEGDTIQITGPGQAWLDNASPLSAGNPYLDLFAYLCELTRVDRYQTSLVKGPTLDCIDLIQHRILIITEALDSSDTTRTYTETKRFRKNESGRALARHQYVDLDDMKTVLSWLLSDDDKDVLDELPDKQDGLRTAGQLARMRGEVWCAWLDALVAPIKLEADTYTDLQEEKAAQAVAVVEQMKKPASDMETLAAMVDDISDAAVLTSPPSFSGDKVNIADLMMPDVRRRLPIAMSANNMYRLTFRIPETYLHGLCSIVFHRLREAGRTDVSISCTDTGVVVYLDHTNCVEEYPLTLDNACIECNPAVLMLRKDYALINQIHDMIITMYKAICASFTRYGL